MEYALFYFYLFFHSLIQLILLTTYHVPVILMDTEIRVNRIGRVPAVRNLY